MNLISHYRMGRILLRYLSNVHGIRLHRIGFIYGNLKPDITTHSTYSSHYTSVLDEVFEDLETFLHAYRSESISGKTFAVKLGEFCHYLSDFFCLAHNDNFYGDIWAHHKYEMKLDQYIRKSKPEDVQVMGTAPALLCMLRDEHCAYGQNEASAAKDARYIPAVCARLCVSAAQICTVAVPKIAMPSEIPETVSVVRDAALGLEAAL